jgi:uncharacterized protein YecE (DUF72 family)
MQEMADMELLRRYVHRNSEAAFAALVARHVNMVYSAAWRKTGSAHAAEEIAQAVFVILAKKADKLRAGTVLSGWLYQIARLTSASFLRTEIRRVRREQEAYMHFIYIRFHGLAGGARHDYSREELQPWARHICGQAAAGKKVFVYFNNDLNVRAPNNANILMEMCSQLRPKAVSRLREFL